MTEKRRYGMSASEWAQARARLECLLGETAATRSTVTYAEAALRAFEGRWSARSSALMALLGEVDSAWDEDRGIMIATLVVRKDTGRPGEGYFLFVEETLDASIDDREAFWVQQAELVYAAFGGNR